MPNPITCAEFLARYSEYRDGLASNNAERQRFTDHVVACPKCRDYDAHVARGVMVLRSSGEIEPSPVLRRRLRDRIAAGRLEDLPLAPAYAGVLVSLMVIVAAAVLVWDSVPPASQPVVAVIDTQNVLIPLQTVQAPAPTHSESSLVVPAFGGGWRSPGADEEPYIMRAVLTR